MKSYIAKAQEVEKKWFVVDAAGKPLGRVASQVASILRGKHKPTFTPNVDCGDHVIVINAEKVVLTGKKLDQKFMRKYSGYVGGLKDSTSGKNTKQGYPAVDLETLLKTSDIVSIHCPLNEQTKGLIGEDSFKLMKNEAILINVGRGGIVDEKALAEALQNNEIAGAGLDVFESEPIAKESPLLQINDASKILMTPHIEIGRAHV